MDKNKVIKYVVIGTPLLIGVYLIYKYLSKPKGEVEPTPTPTTDKDTTTTISTTYTQKNNLPFKKGDKGGYVIAIQRILGITQDGKFGSETDSSVRKYQKKLGLKVDGIVGKDTWRSLFNADFPNEKPYTKAEIDSYTGADKNPYIVEPTPKKPTFVMSSNTI